MKNKQVKETFLPQDLAALAAVFAAGTACFLLGEGWGVLGMVIILCGVMMAPFYHHGYRLKGQKGLFRLKELVLPKENKAGILAYLEGRAASIDLDGWQPGGALVEVYYRKGEDRQFARYYDYADSSKGVEHPLCEVTKAQISFLTTCET